MGQGDYRHFTVASSSLGPDFVGGSFKLNKDSSSGPKSVAQKAARRMFNVEGGAGSSETVHLTLRETTRGSAKSLHEYEARLQRLSPAKTRVIDGKEFVQEYEVAVVPVDRPHGSRTSRTSDDMNDMNDMNDKGASSSSKTRMMNLEQKGGVGSFLYGLSNDELLSRSNSMTGKSLSQIKEEDKQRCNGILGHSYGHGVDGEGCYDGNKRVYTWG